MASNEHWSTPSREGEVGEGPVGYVTEERIRQEIVLRLMEHLLIDMGVIERLNIEIYNR